MNDTEKRKRLNEFLGKRGIKRDVSKRHERVFYRIKAVDAIGANRTYSVFSFNIPEEKRIEIVIKHACNVLDVTEEEILGDDKIWMLVQKNNIEDAVHFLENNTCLKDQTHERAEGAVKWANDRDRWDTLPCFIIADRRGFYPVFVELLGDRTISSMGYETKAKLQELYPKPEPSSIDKIIEFAAQFDGLITRGENFEGGKTVSFTEKISAPS